MNQWCPHFQKGKGCDIYENRPAECASFECLWIMGLISGTLKPSRTGIVAHIDMIMGLLLHEDERADAHVAFREPIDLWTKNGSDIGIIKYGVTA
jgi:hypothetical protein